MPLGSSTPTLFVATKLEAFHGRGDAIFTSHDLEDIITVVDGRPEIVDDVAAADEQVRACIATEFRPLLENADFIEALAGFLLPDAASPGASDHLGAASETARTLSNLTAAAIRSAA